MLDRPVTSARVDAAAGEAGVSRLDWRLTWLCRRVVAVSRHLRACYFAAVAVHEFVCLRAERPPGGGADLAPRAVLLRRPARERAAA